MSIGMLHSISLASAQIAVISQDPTLASGHRSGAWTPQPEREATPLQRTTDPTPTEPT